MTAGAQPAGPPQSAATRLPVWRDTTLRRIAARLAYPVVYLLNRPSMAWFGRAAYDFALRCNGIAINFPGREGLGTAEERFLDAIAPRLAGATVLDVGANAGSFALALARRAPSARIIALEPHPRTFAVLQARLAGTAVEAVQLALGDREGTLELHDFAAADGSTQASLSRDAVALYEGGVVSHPVGCTTLDAFLAARGIARVDFLKIDTEGFDLMVLRGAAKALAEGRIGTIQFEFIDADIATGVHMRDFFEALPGHRIHRLCLNGGLLPLWPYSAKRTEIFVHHNLIAIPVGGEAA